MREGMGTKIGTYVGATRISSSLEYLRDVSAFGVVWFHMRDEWDRSIGYAGLFAFAMITTFLACSSAKRHPLGKYARDRFQRLIVPWIFWSIFYIALRSALSAQLKLRSTGDVLEPAMLLGGGHTVLWYLSFMYLVSMLVFGLVAITSRYSRLGLSIFYLAISVCIVTLVPKLWASTALSYPFAQWLGVAPAVFIGLAAASAVEIQSERVRFKTLLAIAITIVASTIYQSRLGLESGTISLCLGALGFILSLLIKLPESRLINGLSALTLGIYVLHPCIVKLVELSSVKMPFPFDVTLVFALSALCTAALRYSKLLRRVV